MKFIGIETMPSARPPQRGFASTCAELRLQTDEGLPNLGHRRYRAPIIALPLPRQSDVEPYYHADGTWSKDALRDARDATVRKQCDALMEVLVFLNGMWISFSDLGSIVPERSPAYLIQKLIEFYEIEKSSNRLGHSQETFYRIRIK